MKNFFLILASTYLALSAFGQAPKKVILEDYTGTWCGACPRGKTVMEDCINAYPNTIGITMHNSDGLANAYSNAIDAGCGITSYPSGTIDRYLFSGASGLSISTSQWKSKVANRLMASSPVAVSFTSQYNSSTRLLDVAVDVNFVGNVSGDIRINCILVEDGIVTPSDPQKNYMGQGCLAPDPSSPWYSYPCTISNYVHDGVARVNLANDNWGTAGVIPSSVSAGQSFSKNYSYTLPSTWNASKISVVAFVSKGGASATDREIFNAVKGSMGTTTTGIQESSSAMDIEGVDNMPNPFTDHTAIRFQLNKSDMVKIKVCDLFGKEVITLHNTGLTPGEHTFYWFGDDEKGNTVPPGVYYYSISTSSGLVSKPIVFIGKQ